MMMPRTIASLMICAAMLACDREETLEGERFDVRTPLEVAFGKASPDTVRQPRFEAFRPSAPIVPNAWTHVNGSARHNAAHMRAPDWWSPVWRVRIGDGNGQRQRINAAPVVDDGTVFVMDARSLVSAIKADAGDILWQVDLTPSPDSRSDASSGGLAYASGTLYATTGFGSLSALDATTGTIRWVQRFAAAAIGAPVIVGDTIFVVTQDSRAWAIDRANGRLRWSLESAEAPVSLTAGLSPAAAGGDVYFPFPSGELVAAEALRGARRWSGTLGGVAGVGPQATLVGISSMPVVKDGTVYAGNHAGRMTAFDRASGEVIWSLDNGSSQPVLASGNRVFLISERSELMAVDAGSGQRIWSAQLPHHTSRRAKRRKAVHVHFGPYLVDGQLIVFSSDGVMRRFSPQNGQAIDDDKLPDGAAAQPAFARGFMYLVTADGRLHAYR